ncbi:hypothetical protein MHYP_G00021790 [Metynnis hypsauchen]
MTGELKRIGTDSSWDIPTMTTKLSRLTLLLSPLQITHEPLPYVPPIHNPPTRTNPGPTHNLNPTYPLPPPD